MNVPCKINKDTETAISFIIRSHVAVSKYKGFIMDSAPTTDGNSDCNGIGGIPIRKLPMQSWAYQNLFTVSVELIFDPDKPLKDALDEVKDELVSQWNEECKAHGITCTRFDIVGIDKYKGKTIFRLFDLATLIPFKEDRLWEFNHRNGHGLIVLTDPRTRLNQQPTLSHKASSNKRIYNKKSEV